MNIIIRNRETGKVNSVCTLCKSCLDEVKFYWVSLKFGFIYGSGYTSKEEAIKSLEENDKIIWEECKITYNIVNDEDECIASDNGE